MIFGGRYGCARRYIASCNSELPSSRHGWSEYNWSCVLAVILYVWIGSIDFYSMKYLVYCIFSPRLFLNEVISRLDI